MAMIPCPEEHKVSLFQPADFRKTGFGDDYQDELTGDIQLFFESISMKNGHAGSETVYRAGSRTVEHSSFAVRGRIFPRTRKQKEELSIPPDIKTEAQLRAYVKKHRRTWIR